MAMLLTDTPPPRAHLRSPARPADLPICHPDRPALRYDPLRAWHHFRALIRDKEDTRQVFHIFEALPWKGMAAAATALLATPRGQALRAAEPFLPPLLDDHAALRRMPAGSLAHAYCDFMEREGLTAQGLVDEFAAFASERQQFDDQLQWYFHRMRDVHDLLHVLTGYGRDALGEQCVLAFTYSQQPSPANLFIAYAAGWETKRELRGLGKGRDAPVFAAIREGQRLGKACPRLAEQPIMELLALPLEEARRRLGIWSPTRYHAAHAVWREAGVDPYGLLGAKAG